MTTGDYFPYNRSLRSTELFEKMEKRVGCARVRRRYTNYIYEIKVISGSTARERRRAELTLQFLDPSLLSKRFSLIRTFYLLPVIGFR